MTDFSLYLVTDRNLSRGRSTLAIVEKAVSGGVTIVQLREKEMEETAFLKEAMQLKKLLEKYRIPLIINDRVLAAKQIKADGVHLGQSDMPIIEARKILGSSAIIGISAESVDDAVKAEEQGADYIGISPVFETGTKKDTAPPLGLEGVKKIRSLVKIPLVGIGGIHQENAAEVILAGTDGIAVVSAIVSHPSPETASSQLLIKVQEARLRQ